MAQTICIEHNNPTKCYNHHKQKIAEIDTQTNQYEKQISSIEKEFTSFVTHHWSYYNSDKYNEIIESVSNNYIVQLRVLKSQLDCYNEQTWPEYYKHSKILSNYPKN